MALSVGIVGLPNVGKSTLFNALLKKQVALAANYPFATIEPNVGIIEVPDSRLQPLAEIAGTNTIIPAAIEFYDIAGLVRGASEGEGLGNKFLSHIGETSLICHVVRLFEDGDILHVDTSVDPIRDIQTIETELILADLSTLSRQREPKGAATKEDKQRWEALEALKAKLDTGIPARHAGLSAEHIESLRMFNLLTFKPVMYVCNVSEAQLLNMAETEKQVRALLAEACPHDTDFLIISVKMEQELSLLDEKDQKEYLAEFGLSETGLNRLVAKAYSELQLISYLTVGVKEVRAWTITKGTLAPQAAAVIHTDFEKHFIKAEIVPYDVFIEAGGWAGARASGKAILGGKDYEMKDGDVVEFKIGQA
ncbi:redox-regulated ATPase YchF [Candidatus Woesebacteria bacterium]|nr:redox-regulated ATPase YchF [Candidatus Woesebacteria bacterium]